MTTSADELVNILDEQDRDKSEVRFPVTALIFNHDGHNGDIVVPSLSENDALPVVYEHAALADETTVLVVRDENDGWWVLAP